MAGEPIWVPVPWVWFTLTSRIDVLDPGDSDDSAVNEFLEEAEGGCTATRSTP